MLSIFSIPESAQHYRFLEFYPSKTNILNCLHHQVARENHEPIHSNAATILPAKEKHPRLCYKQMAHPSYQHKQAPLHAIPDTMVIVFSFDNINMNIGFV
jgi:hypothetical protein